MRIFHELEGLKRFVKINLHRFDSIGLVYSAVLSRGIQRWVSDIRVILSSCILGKYRRSKYSIVSYSL
jgi:hypothetical protein